MSGLSEEDAQGSELQGSLGTLVHLTQVQLNGRLYPERRALLSFKHAQSPEKNILVIKSLIFPFLEQLITVFLCLGS